MSAAMDDNPHPYYGSCDGLGFDGGCSECDRTTMPAELYEAKRALRDWRWVKRRIGHELLELYIRLPHGGDSQRECKKFIDALCEINNQSKLIEEQKSI